MQTEKEGDFRKNVIRYSFEYSYIYDISCYESAGLYFNCYYRPFEGEGWTIAVNYLLYFKRGNISIGSPITREFEKEKQLTNREIYNFDIGDIFHYQFRQNSKPPIHTKTKVIDKRFNSSNDSVTYNFLDSVYTLGQIPNWDLNIKERTISYALDSLPFISGYFNEFQYNKDTNSIVSNTYLTYFNSRERKFYEGLGAVSSYYRIELVGVDWEITELVYYKKENKESGQKINVSIKRINPNSVKIYPNPTRSKLFVEEISAGAEYKILNPLGAEVLSGMYNGNSISVSDLASGIYLIQITKSGGIFQARFVKE